jgi:hypothetical protein
MKTTFRVIIDGGLVKCTCHKNSERHNTCPNSSTCKDYEVIIKDGSSTPKEKPDLKLDYESSGEINHLTKEEMDKVIMAVGKYFSKHTILTTVDKYKVCSSYSLKTFFSDILGFEVPDKAVKEAMKDKGIPNVKHLNNIVCYPLPAREMKVLMQDVADAKTKLGN